MRTLKEEIKRLWDKQNGCRSQDSVFEREMGQYVDIVMMKLKKDYEKAFMQKVQRKDMEFQKKIEMLFEEIDKVIMLSSFKERDIALNDLKMKNK